MPSVGCAEFILDEVGQAGHVGSYNPLHIRITQTQLYISEGVEVNDSVLPADRYRWRKELKPAGDIVKLNEMIKAYTKDAKIKYVDYHSVLKDENNALPAKYAADGVHPNLECYKIMEEIILQYL